MSLIETDGMTIYIGGEQALFIFSVHQYCPRCGRPAMLFRHRDGHSECLGCSGSDSNDDRDYVSLHTVNSF